MNKLVRLNLLAITLLMTYANASTLHSAPTTCGKMEVFGTYLVEQQKAKIELFGKSQNKFTIELSEKPSQLAQTEFANKKVRVTAELLHLDSPRLATAKGHSIRLHTPEATAGHEGDGYVMIEVRACDKKP